MTYRIDDLLNLIYMGKNKTASSLINAQTINMQNASGLSPLMVAVSARNKRMTVHLLANGADMALRSKAGCTVWEFANTEMKQFLKLVAQTVSERPPRHPFLYNKYGSHIMQVIRQRSNDLGRGRAD